MKRCRLKHYNFQNKNKMNKENKTSDKQQNGNDFIADVSNCGDFEKPETYQVYLNGNWIADCNSYEEAETIANGNAMNGSINIERI